MSSIKPRILVSYPKSGRTWIRYAFNAFNLDLTASHAGTSTNWREIGCTYADVSHEFKNTPLVFLYRSPIDTAVSMYYQVHRVDLRRWTKRWIRMAIPLACRRALPPLDINEFVLHPSYGVPRICRFTRNWLNYLDRQPECMSISYESLRTDPISGFQSILNFYDISSPTGAQLAEVSSFKNMRDAEMSSKKLKFINNNNKKSLDEDSLKVRKGIVGGYTSELSSDSINKCKKIMANHGFI